MENISHDFHCACVRVFECVSNRDREPLACVCFSVSVYTRIHVCLNCVYVRACTCALGLCGQKPTADTCTCSTKNFDSPFFKRFSSSLLLVLWQEAENSLCVMWKPWHLGHHINHCSRNASPLNINTILQKQIMTHRSAECTNARFCFVTQQLPSFGSRLNWEFLPCIFFLCILSFISPLAELKCLLGVIS